MGVGGKHHVLTALPVKETLYRLFSRLCEPQGCSSSVYILKIGMYYEKLFELMCSRNQFNVFHSSFKVTVHIQHNDRMHDFRLLP